ncbi:MAG: RNA-guided pseudouridylation complex pseudouridine synthase subunit Cbf5 [Candidatus Aenigmarchaeota archaeon]|nr:RNA-guided pseudouridylation complex pseudouridine synthase subunit Cbf5 [Candidatus Aenigmarchaeota archaeon]
MVKWIQKSEEGSISDYGTYPGSRTDEELLKKGMIILDKPSGPTSHQVDAWIKEITGVTKASHGGTLDPRVTGVMAIALQDSTKLMPILLSSKKEYIALVNLHKEMPIDDIKKVCNEFIGKIKQLPPIKSAVARRVRERQIYYLEILEIDGRNILMKVGCEAGTYIRRLADDIGKKLGIGAHLQELRRTKSGQFTEKDLVTLQDVIDAFQENKIRDVVHPLELIGDAISSVVVKDTAVDAICNGAPVMLSGIIKFTDDIKKEAIVGIFTMRGEMVGFGKAKMDSETMVNNRRGSCIKTDKVIMKKGTYPKMWKR